MTDSASLARHVPYLRRFARALTGSQETGDGFAIATLECITRGDALPGLDTALRGRNLLFGTFLHLWSAATRDAAVPREAASGPVPAIEAADRRLEAITPLARVVFLLCTVEGFSTVEAGQMLSLTPPKIEALAEQAGREIAGFIRTDVLIIEDEPVIAMDLEALMGELGHTVTGIARTRREAVDAIASHSPGLVLADIRLADGSSGLDAVNDILQICNVPVVFVTAFPERLLTGERPEPAFLITKPFMSETVKAIVSQALFFDRKAALA